MTPLASRSTRELKTVNREGEAQTYLVGKSEIVGKFDRIFLVALNIENKMSKSSMKSMNFIRRLTRLLSILSLWKVILVA